MQTPEREFVEFGKFTVEEKLDYLYVKFLSVSTEIKKVKVAAWTGNLLLVLALLSFWFK